VGTRACRTGPGAGHRLGWRQWRFAITDEDGQLRHCGITSARPTGTCTRIASCRATVELQVPVAALDALGEHLTGLGAWADVVADLARRLEEDAAGANRYAAEARRRASSPALSRYLEIRDRSCIMIGCRAPARTADRTTPATMAMVEPPPTATGATPVDMTTGSSTKAAGGCTSSNPAIFAGRQSECDTL
jgi:hypothetical protein